MPQGVISLEALHKASNGQNNDEATALFVSGGLHPFLGMEGILIYSQGKSDCETPPEHTPPPVDTEGLPASSLEQKGLIKAMHLGFNTPAREQEEGTIPRRLGGGHWMRGVNLLCFVAITVFLKKKSLPFEKG